MCICICLYTHILIYIYMGFPGDSAGEESIYSVGDLALIPGL